MKLYAPVLNMVKQKNFQIIRAAFHPPGTAPFTVSLRPKTNQKNPRAANYSCYLGFCLKIVFRDIFFVLIFFGPEWGISSFSFPFTEIGNYILQKRKKYSLPSSALKRACKIQPFWSQWLSQHSRMGRAAPSTPWQVLS